VEWTVNNANHFTRLKQCFWLGLVNRIVHTLQNQLRFLIGNRSWLVGLAANKPHDTRRFFYQVPRLIGQFHLHQDIARKKFALGLSLLSATHLHHFLGGYQDFTKLVLHAHQFDSLLERGGHFLFIARIRVYYIPSFCHESTLNR